MRIAYLAFIRLPTEKAHGAQIMKTCEAFGEVGATVDLVTPGRRTHIEEETFSFYGVGRTFALCSLNTPDWLRFGSIGFIISALWFSEVARWTKSFRKANIIYSRDAWVLLNYLLLGGRLVYEAHTSPTVLSRFVARRAHRLVVISGGLRDAYLRAGVPSSRIVVAPDAIDMTPFLTLYDKHAERSRLGIPKEAVVALYVGKIDAGKGVPTLAAASAFTSAKIVIIGSGPLVNALKSQYPNVLFLPETAYRDLPSVLTTADVLILPNSASDSDTALYTSPMKAFAYLAAKKPIVASNVPALREIFGDAVTYFNPDDPRDLGKTLNDPEVSSRVPGIRPVTWHERARTILDVVSL